MSIVFVSYASEDRNLAEDLRRGLSDAGHLVYPDERALAVGSEYNAAILKLVQISDYFVFFVSSNSLRQGSHTLTELACAEEKWGRGPQCIIPIITGDVEPGSLPHFLGQLAHLSCEVSATVKVLAGLIKESQTAQNEPGGVRKLILTWPGSSAQS